MIDELTFKFLCLFVFFVAIHPVSFGCGFTALGLFVFFVANPCFLLLPFDSARGLELAETAAPLR